MALLASRAGWFIAAILALVLLLLVAGVARGGGLDPPGPAAPSMKTLDELPPQWHSKLAVNDGPDSCHSSRFRCVLANTGVLDRETGLVWVRAVPATAANWTAADAACQTLDADTTGGWRLPAAEELFSLIDDDAAGLPVGHPFTALTGALDVYWTATHVVDFANVRTVNISDADVALQSGIASQRLYWCVRGRRGYDGW